MGKELLISKVPFIYIYIRIYICVIRCFWGFPSVVDNNSDLLATRPWRIISPTVAVRADPTQTERERERRRFDDNQTESALSLSLSLSSSITHSSKTQWCVYCYCSVFIFIYFSNEIARGISIAAAV